MHTLPHTLSPRIMLALRRGASGTRAAARMYSGSPARRVVVTGLGAVTPLGKNLSLMWPRLLEGETAVRALRNQELYKDIPVHIAAEVDRDPESEDGFSLDDWHEGTVSLLRHMHNHNDKSHSCAQTHACAHCLLDAQAAPR